MIAVDTSVPALSFALSIAGHMPLWSTPLRRPEVLSNLLLFVDIRLCPLYLRFTNIRPPCPVVPDVVSLC